MIRKFIILSFLVVLSFVMHVSLIIFYELFSKPMLEQHYTAQLNITLNEYNKGCSQGLIPKEFCEKMYLPNESVALTYGEMLSKNVEKRLKEHVIFNHITEIFMTVIIYLFYIFLLASRFLTREKFIYLLIFISNAIIFILLGSVIAFLASLLLQLFPAFVFMKLYSK